MLVHIAKIMGLFALSLVLTTTAVFANDPVARTNTSTLWFEGWGSLFNATLTVTGPEGDRTETFKGKGTPQFALRDMGDIVDGVYSYELTAATDEMVKIKNPINNGRGDAEKTEIPKSYQMTGSFIVSRGVIIKKEEILEQ